MDFIEISKLFDYVRIKKSKPMLYRFFSKEEFDMKETLRQQKILKFFLKNLAVISQYKTNDHEVQAINSFINDSNYENYNFTTKLFYTADFDKINNNIAFFIHFFYSFKILLEKIISNDRSDNYNQQMIDIVDFINTFSIDEQFLLLSKNRLTFNKRKALLKKIVEVSDQKGFMNFWNFFYMFDVYYSIAKGINVLGLCFPEFNNDGIFKIEEFYHLQIPRPVKNSVDFSNKNTIIFTGPNMSGKSTVMKSVSIIVLLTHLGIAVPAAYCNIPFYQKIKFFFNTTDSIENGHSYFMQELLNLKDVLSSVNSGQKCFVAFDEIFKGTNINDSIKITIQVVNGLSKFSESKFIISTHLNMIEDKLETMNCLKLKLKSSYANQQLEFSYKLEEGWSKLEVGSILFNQLGISQLLNMVKL
jgi:hypothetical protein